MFIRSIKLSGLFDVEGSKQHTFIYNNDNEDTIDSYINNITDHSIIQGFLLIFDLKYDSKYNYKNIINKNHHGDSFVEITLYSNESRESCHFDWLQNNELKLKRVLEHPKSIFINKKRYDLSIFHEALASIGFLNINDLCFHKLLDDDVSHLCKFSGDDLWNMLLKVTEHDELIEMIEQKKGIYKKKVMKRSFEYIADTVEREIPKKIELRNKIYERVQLNKNFFTLYYILTGRKMEIFEKQIENTDEKIKEFITAIDENTYGNHENKRTFETSYEKAAVSENAFKLMQEVSNEIKDVVENYKGEPSNQIISLMESFSKLKTHNIDQSTELSDDYEINELKKCLQDSVAKGTFEETKEMLKVLHKRDEIYLNFLESSDDPSLFDETCLKECEINQKVLFNVEEKFITEYNVLAESLSTKLNESEDQLAKIKRYAKDLKISTNEFETLLDIERTVQLCSEDIKSDYLGPVFQYLDPKCRLDVKVWSHIYSISQIIFFKTSECRLKFLKTFLSTYKPTYGFPFMALDDYEVKPYDENIHNNENVVSLHCLVRNDIDKRLKLCIKSLLNDYLLAVGPWKNIEGIEIYKVICYDQMNSVCHSFDSCSIHKEYNNIWELLDNGPAEMIQFYYNAIKEYLIKEFEISSILNKKEKLPTNCEKFKTELINEQIKAVCSKTSIRTEETTKIKSYLEKSQARMRELLDASADDCKDWKIQKLNNKEFEKIVKSFYVDNSTMDSNVQINMIQKNLSEIMANSEKAFNRDGRLQLMTNENFETFLKNHEMYENLVTTKLLYTLQLYDSIEVFLEDSEKNMEVMQEFTKLYGEKFDIKTKILDELQNILDILDQNQMYTLKKSIYDEFVNQDTDSIFSEISDVHKELIYQKSINRIDLKSFDFSVYNNLVESLGKVKEFSSKNVFAPLKVHKRAYPLMNMVVIKVLKDTVHNFTLTYNSILADYISYSNLLFYTKSSLINENNDDSFNWNCFDIAKLKAIEFVENWKDNRKILPSPSRQLIKALLLILHIINYISIFKFIVISEKIFENFDQALADRLRKFLQSISQFVQIILYNERGNEERLNAMEIDENDILED